MEPPVFELVAASVHRTLAFRWVLVQFAIYKIIKGRRTPPFYDWHGCS